MATVTRKLTGNEMRKGMSFQGREFAHVRQGVGSGKVWTYVTYADGTNGRFRRNTVKVEVEVPVETA